jgi:hypothetical protein
MYETSSATATRQDAGCFVDYDARVNLGKHRVVCGCSWLLRVVDHEAALMDPKLFSSWVHRSVVLLKRRFGRQTSSRWRFSRKNDWIVPSTNSAASDAHKGHTGALYSKNSDPAAEAGMALFTTALDLYGGVLCSGELQGFIIHETMPAVAPAPLQTAGARTLPTTNKSQARGMGMAPCVGHFLDIRANSRWGGATRKTKTRDTSVRLHWRTRNPGKDHEEHRKLAGAR